MSLPTPQAVEEAINWFKAIEWYQKNDHAQTIVTLLESLPAPQQMAEQAVRELTVAGQKTVAMCDEFNNTICYDTGLREVLKIEPHVKYKAPIEASNP